MSWRLRILHRTEYEYEDVVHASYNEARISPLDATPQLTIEHRFEVEPTVSVYRYRDYWGTRVHAFDVHQPHRRLVVTGHSLVETAPPPPAPSRDVTWDDVRAPGVKDRYCELLDSTPATALTDDVAALAAELARPTPAATLEAVVTWLRDELVYEQGSTDVTTTAAQVLDQRRGVCQDFAHLGIALLRSTGIPARYSSGYQLPHDDAELGVTYDGQGHAWIEAWIGEWHPVDPTSGSVVAERHVVVARGREYADVTPLKGVYHGGAARGLDVTVQLTRVA